MISSQTDPNSRIDAIA